eukprot:93047-Prymnesium_polylepis.1
MLTTAPSDMGARCRCTGTGTGFHVDSAGTSQGTSQRLHARVTSVHALSDSFSFPSACLLLHRGRPSRPPAPASPAPSQNTTAHTLFASAAP